jgi:hypothetical protein
VKDVHQMNTRVVLFFERVFFFAGIFERVFEHGQNKF